MILSVLGIETVNLEVLNVHVVAGVLKMFFRELAVPVITADFYTDFMRTAGRYCVINVLTAVEGHLAMKLE